MTAADFNNLVINTSEGLHPYAISLTRDNEAAQDLYQETILRALSNRDKYRMGTNLKGWLYTIMRNIFINNYNRSKKIISTDYSLQPDSTYQLVTVCQSDIYEKTNIKDIYQAIDNLPDKLQAVFELHYNGYKYYEIARILNEPVGTVKSRLHSSRKYLMTAIRK
jgi:RNA polymerase sigma-70 factor (ECF subfamily)